MEKNIVLQNKKKIRFFREFGVLTVLIAIIIVLSIATPTFSKPINLINVVRQTVEISIMAIGMTFVIVSAEIDLSVGSIFGSTAMLAALLIKMGIDPGVAFFASIGMGCCIGLLNGMLSTKARMPAFIVTLGTMQIFRSVAYGISNGQSVSAFPESVLDNWVFKIGSSIGVIPVQVIIMIGMFIVAHIIMSKTKFGFDIYATGGNKRAAQLGGINTDRIKIINFVVNGALCAFAGIISITYLKSVPTSAGGGREMDIIAAVILGGCALTGGKGTILGTLIGATIMSVIRNGMVLLAVPAFWQAGFIGVVIILAVLLDTWITRSSKCK